MAGTLQENLKDTSSASLCCSARSVWRSVPECGRCSAKRS